METQTKMVRLATPDKNGNLTINNMTIRLMSADRSRKDIGKFIDAVEMAESVYWPNRSELYDIYTQILLDPHLSGIIDKCIASVLNKTLCFRTNDDTEAESISGLIEEKAFRDMLREIMWQKFWGISGFEFIPGKTFAFNRIPRKHIKPNLRMISADEYGSNGFTYEGLWNIWVIGEWGDLGQLLSCAPWALYKKDSVADWAQYIELFGQPIIVTKYDSFDEKTKKELDDVMRNAGSSLRLQIPNQANFEIIDGKSSNNGTGELQEKFKEACNKEMSIRILGASETTGSSSSSGYAQSKEHGRQQDEIIKNHMVDVLHHLNSPQFKTILKSYGLPAESGNFYYEDEVNYTEVQSKLNIATQVRKITPVSDDYIYEITSVPKPKNYDQLKAEKQKPVNNPVENDDDDDPDDPGADSNFEKTKGQKAKASLMQRIRAAIADFFEPAP